MFTKIIIGVVIVAAVIGLAYYLTRPTQNQNNQQNVVQVNFKQTGNLVINNPGLKQDTWYLVYDQPGSPGVSKELKFTTMPSIQKGMRAYVEGVDQNGAVSVTTLNLLNAVNDDLIWVSAPLPNDTAKSPLTVTGYARGSWYFEAVFPIKLLDANDKVLAQGQGHAQSSWTTTDYVPFTATLTFSNPTTDTGTLLLQNDNPSGLAQNAKEVRVPVKLDVKKQTVKLYYYNPQNDKDASGNILCSRQGLVSVDRQIPVTNTPIQDTVKLLLQGSLTDQEKASGITTEYPLAGLTLVGASLKSGVLTLEFNDAQNKTVGGSCRVGILWFQIEATAKQFAGVSTVKFKPDTLFQP